VVERNQRDGGAARRGSAETVSTAAGGRSTIARLDTWSTAADREHGRRIWRMLSRSVGPIMSVCITPIDYQLRLSRAGAH